MHGFENMKTLCVVLFIALGPNLMANDNFNETNSELISIKHAIHLRRALKQVVDWTVTKNDLTKQTNWDGRTQTLPLSSTNAVQVAFKEVQFRCPNIAKWKVEHVLLRNLAWDKGMGQIQNCSNVWYYLVSFAPADDADGIALTDSGQDLYWDQLVLLDGTLAKIEIGPIVKVETPVKK